MIEKICKVYKEGQSKYEVAIGVDRGIGFGNSYSLRVYEKDSNEVLVIPVDVTHVENNHMLWGFMVDVRYGFFEALYAWARELHPKNVKDKVKLNWWFDQSVADVISDFANASDKPGWLDEAI